MGDYEPVDSAMRLKAGSSRKYSEKEKELAEEINKKYAEPAAKGQHHMAHKTSQDFIERATKNIGRKEHELPHWGDGKGK